MSIHPHQHKTRLILSTDTKNEADDQFAVVHALLTPSFEIEGIVAAHFGTERGSASMEASRQEIDYLMELLGAGGVLEVENGASVCMPDEATAVPSPGSELMIRAIMSDDPRPLSIACLGPLTDLASAVLTEPRILSKKVRVVWIGGGPWPDGGWEFNLLNDIAAANVVFQSGLDLVQIPRPVFNWMPVGYAEMEAKVAPCGDIGRYLVDEVYRFNDTFYSQPIEQRPLADSAAIGVLMYENSGRWTSRPAPLFAPDMSYRHTRQHGDVRVFESIDSRFILEDFFAKLARYSQDGTLPFLPE